MWTLPAAATQNLREVGVVSALNRVLALCTQTNSKSDDPAWQTDPTVTGDSWSARRTRGGGESGARPVDRGGVTREQDVDLTGASENSRTAFHEIYLGRSALPLGVGTRIIHRASGVGPNNILRMHRFRAIVFA
jgi:hypothetical protein